MRGGLKKLGAVVAKGSLLIGAAFAAAMVVSIKKANDFQKAMSNVATVIDTSVTSTQDMTKALLRMDPALGTTTELTNGLYQAFSAGAVDAEEALRITEDSAKFAGAALTDMATAVDVLTTAQNAYGSDLVTTTQASDIFFKTIEKGKITGAQLSAVIGQSIPLFASMNIPLEQLASGMAAMTKQGISASEATTQMNAMVNAFIKPSGEMTAALKELGFESGATFIETQGLSGALEFLETATGGSKDEMAKLVPNIRGLKGVMALTGTGGEIFNEVMAEMADVTGATDVAFAKQEKTFETFKNTLDRTMIIVGNIGKAFVDEIAVGATDAFQAMNDFLMTGQAAEIFGQVIGTIAAAFAGVIEFTRPIVETIGTALGEIFTSIGDAIVIVTGEADTASGAFNVLGIVAQSISFGISLVSQVIQSNIEIFGGWVKAITETGKAVGLLFQIMSKDVTWDDVKAQFGDAGDAFKTLGTNYVDSFVDLYKTGAEELKGFATGAEDITTNISSSVESTYANVKNVFTSTWDSLITGQEDFTEDLVIVAQEGGEAYLGYYGSASAEFVGIWENAWDQMKTGNSGAFDDLISGVQEGLDTVTSIYDSSFGAILDVQSMFLQNQATAENLAFENQILALDASLAAGAVTEEEYNLQKEAIETAHAKKMNAIEKKQFEAGKASQIAQVWMDAATSIMGWWAAAPQLGIIAGPIVAGIMTGVTLGTAAAQSVAIGQQQFVPAFASGGMMRGSGFARINEQGGEIQQLGDGTLVIPNDISQQIAGASGQVINVSFAGAQISDSMDLNRIVEKVSQKLGRQMRNAS